LAVDCMVVPAVVTAMVAMAAAVKVAGATPVG
jgi:hypothetical protein